MVLDGVPVDVLVVETAGLLHVHVEPLEDRLLAHDVVHLLHLDDRGLIQDLEHEDLIDVTDVHREPDVATVVIEEHVEDRGVALVAVKLLQVRQRESLEGYKATCG